MTKERVTDQFAVGPVGVDCNLVKISRPWQERQHRRRPDPAPAFIFKLVTSSPCQRFAPTSLSRPQPAAPQLVGLASAAEHLLMKRLQNQLAGSSRRLADAVVTPN